MQSEKWKRLYRVYGPVRDEYIRRFTKCVVCNDRPPRDVHEILRGIYRAAAFAEPCCWLAVCRECHDELGDPGKWSIPMQLALKLEVDPETFDLEKINYIHNPNAPNWITMPEVTRLIAEQ